MILRRVLGAQGITFGVMDGVITVLGVLAGLYFLGDRLVIIAGMLIAGIADSLANAAGIHVSQETEGHHGQREVLMSTLMAFIGTFFVTLILVLPHFFLGLYYSTISSIILGFLMVVGVGFFVAKRFGKGGEKTCKIICEYVFITILVVLASFLIGSLIGSWLGVGYV